MRLLVIGARGFLGGWLTQSRDDRFEFCALDRTACDVTNPASVRSAFEAARPEIAILTAALADIDRCEKEPDLARAVNVGGAENVARECARTGVRLIFTSSGAVFDGEAPEYRESDPPSPLSVYGKTKADAEHVIQQILPDPAIVRLSTALGYSVTGATNALLDKLQSAFRAGRPVYSPVEEYRNAIDAGTLTHWLLDLACARGRTGIFHLGSSDAVSRYEIVSRLAEAMGYSKDLVIPQNALADRAPRGRIHMLLPTRIQEFSTVGVPSCLQAIERCAHVGV
jgi:dTDP-4-dehydrorhamnose reductase